MLDTLQTLVNEARERLETEGVNPYTLLDYQSLRRLQRRVEAESITEEEVGNMLKVYATCVTVGRMKAFFNEIGRVDIPDLNKGGAC